MHTLNFFILPNKMYMYSIYKDISLLDIKQNRPVSKEGGSTSPNLTHYVDLPFYISTDAYYYCYLIILINSNNMWVPF